MEPISQRHSLDPAGIVSGEQARFWQAPQHDGLECLSARFTRHRYAPHSHETYVFGIIVAGVEVFDCRGMAQVAQAGDVCFVNPGDVHDGAPGDKGYAYRMIYPSVALVRKLAGGDGPLSGTPFFRDAVRRDPWLYACFLRLHRLLEDDADPMLRDEVMHDVIRAIVSRHAEFLQSTATVADNAGGLGRVRDSLGDHADQPLSLADAAKVAGVSEFALLRQFKRAFGITPHAFLTDCRVQRARARLRAGETPGLVAAACGFCDQSHLNRAFKARVGVTPGQYRSAFLRH